MLIGVLADRGVRAAVGPRAASRLRITLLRLAASLVSMLALALITVPPDNRYRRTADVATYLEDFRSTPDNPM